MRDFIKILGYTKNLWPYYVAVAVAAILVAGTNIAGPFVLQRITDLVVSVAEGENIAVSAAITLALVLFALDLTSAFFGNIGRYLGDVMSAKLRTSLSEKYFHKLLSLPHAYYDSELTGKIINRLNRTIKELANFVNGMANNFLQMFLTVIAILTVVFFYSWELALMILILLPSYVWLTMLTSKKWQVLQKDINKKSDIASGRFAEVVAQMKVVKSFVSEKSEHSTFKSRFEAIVGVVRRQSSYWHKMDFIRGVVLGVIFFGFYAFLFAATVQQRFSVGEMVLLITLMNQVRRPIYMMSFIVDMFQRAITGSTDYGEVMALEPDIKDKPGAKQLTVSRGMVGFNDIEFHYEKDKPVLKGINFEIKPGEKVALVGESGEGKTTISNLLMRLYEPTGGSITIDGQDITDVTQSSLRSNIATVFQEPALFSGTILENIAYGNPSASKDDVEKAAKAASAHEFISKFKQGYSSQIGERGLKLSGGQKQRIAVARAILKDAPILILDEATSSLDSKSEALVQSALNKLMTGRTTLIIAHRLSTIASVDRIVTLRGGSVDEVGPPNELAKSGGIYAQLLKLQSSTAESAKEKLKSFEING